jgi:hypothetical protein
MAFKTKELPREEAARGRRAAKTAAKHQGGVTAVSTQKSRGCDPHGAQGKVFNLNTYKLHSLGDYVVSIKLFGTTDNYNTQVVILVQFFTSAQTDGAL